MGSIRATSLADPATYRRLAYLFSAMPLGLTWFVALVTVWSLCIGLAVTPFVIPLLFALAWMTRGFAAVEVEVARSLLDADVHPPFAPAGAGGLWARMRALFEPGFWRAQSYLMLRWFAGFPVGVLIFGLLITAVGGIFAPIWVPLVHGGAELGFWRPHTFVQALALVPAGLLLLPLSLLVVNPLAAPFRSAALHLFRAPTESHGRGSGHSRSAAAPAVPSRRALNIHAAVDAAVVLGLATIWAVTSRGYFWPIWVVLPMAVALGIHGWFVWLGEQPSLVERFRGSRGLAGTVGVEAVVAAFFVAVWAITGHRYFWPIWPVLVMAIVLVAVTAAVLLSSPNQSEMAERIETLESTRAGAVNLQGSELRRIERDLHDGAQARLVALGMSLGMAEQKLTEDPERVGELLAEARAGAETALRELRNLARGIHPPVLADRGLEAALASLANSTPMSVSVSVRLAQRPAPAVETAAYFVVAEALANAAKHAHADRVDIRIAQTRDRLELQVEDDGTGGADPGGTGMLGMRRRVEALDGRLSVTSPAGGPTTIRAELPCAS